MGEATLTRAQIAALRNDRYHRRRDKRLASAEDIRAFVNEAGVCLLFPVQGIELPNVYQAVAGFEKPMTAQHDDPHIALTWETKDRALDRRWWYYGKLIKGKATLVSLDLLPHFYALSENFGDEDDYLHEYAAGTLSADAKNIYEALLRHGPLHAIEIKRKANLYGDALKARFDKALTELQVGLKVLPVGVAEAGAWRYAFIYEIVSRWFPDLPAQARAITRSEARVAILARHLHNVVAAQPKELARLFGWKPAEVEAAVRKLIERGQAKIVTVTGVQGEVVMATD
ncbi:MAG: crosslink repair DNA glycosylase YcaQ family protein [Anaerolineae bacterium]|nr:winged helix DNA-binding domain-containing protein [Candidatus Roseilinea sp.]MDW8448614.1 crosslink repair DNA glycosylase YcaQ family protein [Anaerolineae bacterium]